MIGYHMSGQNAYQPEGRRANTTRTDDIHMNVILRKQQTVGQSKTVSTKETNVGMVELHINHNVIK